MTTEESDSYIDSHSDSYRLNNIAESSRLSDSSFDSCSDGLDDRRKRRKVRRRLAAEAKRPKPYPFAIKTPMTYIRRKEFKEFDLTAFQNSHEEEQKIGKLYEDYGAPRRYVAKVLAINKLEQKINEFAEKMEYTHISDPKNFEGIVPEEFSSEFGKELSSI